VLEGRVSAFIHAAGDLMHQDALAANMSATAASIVFRRDMIDIVESPSSQNPRGDIRFQMITGLFLGAGASFELGMPLVWDLTAELRAWLTPDMLRGFNHGWRPQGGGYPDEVIEDLAAILQTPGMHYESMLGHLQVQFRRSSRFRQDYHGLYAWLVEVVYLLLYHRHIKNESYISMGLRYFEGIIGLAREIKPLWIFSLNHDLVVECLCAQYGISVNSGFVETAVLPRLDGAGKKTGDLPVRS
jgi:hypothetical protein